MLTPDKELEILSMFGRFCRRVNQTCRTGRVEFACACPRTTYRLRVFNCGFAWDKKTCVMRSGVKALISAYYFFLSVSLSRVAGGPVAFLSEPRLQVPQTLRKEVKGNGF